MNTITITCVTLPRYICYVVDNHNGVIWNYGVDCTFYVHANEWKRSLEIEKW